MTFRNYFILALILLLHLSLLFVLKFTAWPEMLFWPYLMTKGWLPYRDIAIAHTPLVLFDLSIFYKLFGVGIVQLKIFTWLLILIFDLVVFVVVKSIWNIKTAFFSLIFYSIWMLFYDGNGLWFDLYMGFLAFFSFYFVRKRNWFWAFIFWSLAFLAKQTAIWFLIPILYSVFIVRQPLKGIGKSVLVVFGLFFILIFASGVLNDFWNWAIKFGIFVLPRSQGQIQLPAFRSLIFSLFPFLIFFFSDRKFKNFDLLLWSLAGFLGVYPRFELFHFQPALPYLAIFTALLVFNLQGKFNFYKLFFVFYFLICFSLFALFFRKNFKKETRFYENDVKNVVSYIKNETSSNEKILILNWWDSVYALTDTLPVFRPFVPQLPWYQNLADVQEIEVSNLKEEKPNLVLLYPYSSSGLSSFVPDEVFDYVKENYDFKKRIGNIEVLKCK